jgi:hypothetical protein
VTGPPRDVRADAARAFSRRFAHEAHAERPTPPDSLGRELLVILDSHQIGLVDLRRPVNPDADPFTRPTPAPPDSDGLAQYRAARAAQAHKDQP